MGTIKTNGIILSEHNMNDYDKMVTILTPGLGKIECAAKGARRPKSALLASTQFLCFGEYIVYKGSNTYNINSSETIEVFYNIRTDLDKLRYAAHVTNIIKDVTTENQNSYKILQLFLNTIYTISETDKNLDLTASIFKIKLMCILGYIPQIEKCCTCRTLENLNYFSFRDNGLKCQNCGKQDKSSMQISNSTEKALKYIVLAPAKKIFSFNLSENCIKEIKLIADIYTNNKLEKEYKLEKF